MKKRLITLSGLSVLAAAVACLYAVRADGVVDAIHPLADERRGGESGYAVPGHAAEILAARPTENTYKALVVDGCPNLSAQNLFDAWARPLWAAAELHGTDEGKALGIDRKLASAARDLEELARLAAGLVVAEGLPADGKEDCETPAAFWTVTADDGEPPLLIFNYGFDTLTFTREELNAAINKQLKAMSKSARRLKPWKYGRPEIAALARFLRDDWEDFVLFMLSDSGGLSPVDMALSGQYAPARTAEEKDAARKDLAGLARLRAGVR